MSLLLGLSLSSTGTAFGWAVRSWSLAAEETDLADVYQIQKNTVEATSAHVEMTCFPAVVSVLRVEMTTQSRKHLL